MVNTLKNKKILILGGLYLHCQVVNAAKRLGAYTIVTDNIEDLDKAPAKKIADKYYNINISDVDGIVEMCKAEGVDGVVTLYLDFAQLYYEQICKKLNLPCYGSYEQFQICTNKELFKEKCKEYGVDIIETYTEDDIDNSEIYPVMIKPAHNRGSRGQSVCYNKDDAIKAIELAKSMSDTNTAIIEKYLGKAEDFQVTYLSIEGKHYVSRTADRHLGYKELGMDKVAIALSSPSKNTEVYMEKAHKNVCKMLDGLGINNGPFFMQGFYDGNTFRFYDPGLRFPGGNYDSHFYIIMGFDNIEMVVEFSVTGKIRNIGLTDDSVYLKGNHIFTLHTTVREGVITYITPEEKLLKIKGVRAVAFRHHVGDKIEKWCDVRQRIAEFNIVGSSVEEVKESLRQVQKEFKVLDENGDNMLFCEFDVEGWRQ